MVAQWRRSDYNGAMNATMSKGSGKRGRPNRPLPAPPNRLREYRLAANLTQAALAELVGVGETTIANAELYGRSLGKRNWYKLANIFNVDPRVLENYEAA